ncbi:MAG: putative phospho-glucose isomerase [Blastococcus sp.]|nr:putative phospho-glucose isomerase [Blastococcus sp.]
MHPGDTDRPLLRVRDPRRLSVSGFRLPDQRVAVCAVLSGPLAPRDADDFFRDRADDDDRRLRLLTIRDAVDDGAGEREPRSAAEAMQEVLRSAAAHTVPVSALAEHGDPGRFARLPRLARQLAVADFAAVYLALALDNERARGT